LSAIDWMRGLVMILMTVDHASDAFNAGRIMSDAAWLYKPGTPLPLAQFLTRWITHLCAPTFVFLAGASLSLSVAKRTARGERPGSIDAHIVTRGLFIAALDPLWMTLGFFGGWSRIILQVMYAIGFSLVLMAGLRRLPAWALTALAVAFIGGVDFMVGRAFDHPTPGGGGSPPLVIGALISGGLYGRVILAYPILPWLGIMMLGWAFGTHVSRDRDARSDGLLFVVGAVALGTFGLLRGLDGFGNAGLHRDDGSLAQWLHVSKYPPSLTYCGLELGIMALLLGAFFRLERAGAASSAPLRFLEVLGSNALFFYLLHVHLLVQGARILHIDGKFGIGAAFLGAAVATVVLWLACRSYAAYKRSHDNLVTRWV
jgi:uncharacterized membrane protein